MKQPMEKALEVVLENVQQIRTVVEWGQQMGYGDTKKFSEVFKKHYKKSPKSVLIVLRLERFHTLIKEHPEISCFELGIELGLGGERELNEYIRYHTGHHPHLVEKSGVKFKGKIRG